jgi:hypothetical protein
MNKENNVYLLLPNQTETICINDDILIHCKKINQNSILMVAIYWNVAAKQPV